MAVTVVAKARGGAGKGTLSTNIAACAAARGKAVMLGNADRQHSSCIWLRLRPAALLQIQTWTVMYDDIFRPHKGTRHVALDTPVDQHGKRLNKVMKLAEKIAVPLQPGIYDFHAVHEFFKQIKVQKTHRSTHTRCKSARSACA